jgi:hypothetical protein
VRDSDGTAIFSLDPILTGGSRKTLEFARKHRKPAIHLTPACVPPAEQQLRQFLQEHGIQNLNIAGPRGSKEPTVGAFVVAVLEKTILPLDEQGKSRQTPNP